MTMMTSAMPTALRRAVPVIPESAPFSGAQRAWLNGFLAGLVNEPSAQPVSELTESIRVEQEEEELPWHDPALSMDERLKLAEGQPTERVLMAAMAQLDCGACGYVCKTYAEAIVRGEEKELTKCAPGGAETAKKLKQLLPVGGASAAVVVPVSELRVKTSPPPDVKRGHDRRNPFPARLLACSPLNKSGSKKDTRLVALDLKHSGLSYKVGDSLGVYPQNCPDAVQWILEAFKASGAETVANRDGSSTDLHDMLLRHCVISKPSARLVELLAESASDATEAGELKTLADGGVPEGIEIVDLLTQFSSARPAIDAFVAALAPLQPRLYSIASSPKAHPDQVHLTVGVVRFLNGRGRQCKGVASTYLAERVRPGEKVKVFLQPSHRFNIPLDGQTPMIMVGPGTGIAPFRAFLQERKAMGASGKNWLFFGDQCSECDFLYEEELKGYQRDGLLTRLDTAFSRDQREKIYVQHRMLQNAPAIWAWLQEGGCFYVCGDAKRMARDVEQALKQIVAEQGNLSPEAAGAYIAELSKSKRYQRDVY
ncbi:MAG TPA: sulfite reductase subunit alpha [Tepidisphaeraceae bacterium]|nr:sulfite reductase subunit alpha [Tepidisphaeraceae bacterium]